MDEREGSVSKGYERPVNMAQLVQKSLDDAERDGRFRRNLPHLCGRCRQWTNSIYYVVPLVRIAMCPTCADTIGQGPIADGKKKERAA
jgi:hypothetical protein